MITTNGKQLLNALRSARRVADRKSAMPMLQSVLLTSGDGALTVSATDLYLAITTQVPAVTADRVHVAVDAAALHDRVAMLTDGDVCIAVDDAGSVTVRAAGGSRRYRLSGIPGDEYPPLPAPDADAASVTVQGADLHALISGTVFSASEDESRSHLNSALLTIDADLMRAVTTDGHRLTLREVAATGNLTALVPFKGWRELAKLAESTGSLTLTQHGASLYATAESVTLSVKLVDAQFPPWRDVVPQTTAVNVEVPRLALADALRAVAVAANDRTGGVALTFAKGSLRLASESPETGEGSDEIAVDYTGKKLVIGVNARYMLDLLGSMSADAVTLGMSGDLDPILVTGEVGVVGVVMPMRV
jgi:DNA polymerase III subunit beta